MGATYYMKNRKTREYTCSLGKRGEFDPVAICFVLGWDTNDTEIENDDETYEIHGFDILTGTHDPNQAWTRINNIPWDNTYRYIFNYSNKEYIDMEKYQYIPDSKHDVLSQLNWNNDKVLFITDASYGYHNLSNDEFRDFFVHRGKYTYKQVNLPDNKYSDDGFQYVTYC